MLKDKAAALVAKVAASGISTPQDIAAAKVIFAATSESELATIAAGENKQAFYGLAGQVWDKKHVVTFWNEHDNPVARERDELQAEVEKLKGEVVAKACAVVWKQNQLDKMKRAADELAEYARKQEREKNELSNDRDEWIKDFQYERKLRRAAEDKAEELRAEVERLKKEVARLEEEKSA